MTYKEFNFIKDAFSQIIDDIAGNPDWYEASKAVASDLGELERELKEKFIKTKHYVVRRKKNIAY